MAMSFVNYSMLTKKTVRNCQKTLFWERYQLIALFRVFSWFDVIRMDLRDEEMAVRLWGPVTKERALQLGALAASSSVLLKTHAMVPYHLAKIVHANIL